MPGALGQYGQSMLLARCTAAFVQARKGKYSKGEGIHLHFFLDAVSIWPYYWIDGKEGGNRTNKTPSSADCF